MESRDVESWIWDMQNAVANTEEALGEVYDEEAMETMPEDVQEALEALNTALENLKAATLRHYPKD